MIGVPTAPATPGPRSAWPSPGLAEAAARLPVVAAAVGLAWLLIAAAQLTGTAALLHHHALIEHGPPLWIAVPAFLLGWLVMIVAMMIPASLPAIAAYAASIRDPSVARFLTQVCTRLGGLRARRVCR